MRETIQTEHTPGTGTKVLFVLGWGVTLRDSGIIWFTNQARKQDWNMVAVQIPNGFRSFRSVLEQIDIVQQEHQPEVIISFSMGALFSAYIEAPLRIFISPFWGVPRKKLIRRSKTTSRRVMRALRWIRLPIIPRGYRNRDIGTIDVSDLIPSFISPATVYQVFKAQMTRPSALPSDRIFYCPTDSIIDISKCTETSVFTFSGGHDFMATSDRERVFAAITELISQKCAALQNPSPKEAL